jgi:hypothetical protein
MRGLNVLERIGGRTRARTWDPMIKSYLVLNYLKRLRKWRGRESILRSLDYDSSAQITHIRRKGQSE